MAGYKQHSKKLTGPTMTNKVEDGILLNIIYIFQRTTTPSFFWVVNTFSMLLPLYKTSISFMLATYNFSLYWLHDI